MKRTNWNEWDNAPAKTRFVKNEIELSERRIKRLWESAKRKERKEATILFAISMGASLVEIIVLTRHEWFLKQFRNLLSSK